MQVETRITCPLSDMQTFWYRRLLLKDSKLLIKLEKEDQTVQVHLAAKQERRLLLDMRPVLSMEVAFCSGAFENTCAIGWTGLPSHLRLHDSQCCFCHV
jgi:hypothetical protein